MTYHLIRSSEPTTAEEVATRLYRTFRGSQTSAFGTKYQVDGVCLLFEGHEGRYLWGVRPVGVTSIEGADKPATSFHVRDITVPGNEMEQMRWSIRKVKEALSGK